MEKPFELNWIDDTTLEATFTGIFDFDLATQAADKLASLEADHPGYRIIIDFTEVTEIAIGTSDIRAISNRVKEKSKRSGDTAYVVGLDSGRFVMAKMFTSMVNLFAPGKHKVFSSANEAKAWLLHEDEDDFEFV